MHIDKRKKNTKLNKLFQEHIKMKFPQILSDNDELFDIKGELVLYGGHVAGLVSSYLNNAPVNFKFVTVDDNLENKLNTFIPSTEEEKRDLNEHIAYKHKLDELVILLKEILEV